MRTLFLTNNLEATRPLFEWLKRTEGDDDVLLFSEKLTGAQFAEGGQFSRAEFIVSYNYSHIIGEDVISRFPRRIINLHTSMLPWNRGASPNIWSFLEGTPAGVTIHEVDEGVDTGDILLQRGIVCDFETETLKSSYDRSHAVMRELFCEHWDALKNGRIAPRPQAGTRHFRKDSSAFDHIIDYDDTIADFIGKHRRLRRTAAGLQSLCEDV